MIDIAGVLQSADEKVDVSRAEYHNGEYRYRWGDARSSCPGEDEYADGKSDAPDHGWEESVFGRHLVRREAADLSLVE